MLASLIESASQMLHRMFAVALGALLATSAASESLADCGFMLGEWRAQPAADSPVEASPTHPLFALNKIHEAADGIWIETTPAGEASAPRFQLSHNPTTDSIFLIEIPTRPGQHAFAVRVVAPSQLIAEATLDGAPRERLIFERMPDRRLRLTHAERVAAADSTDEWREKFARTFTPKTLRVTAGEIAFEIDGAWERVEPRSRSQLAIIALPPQKREDTSASLVVYYFGPEGAGTVAANLDRWASQVEAEVKEGETAPPAAGSRSSRKVDEFEIAIVEKSGTYKEQGKEAVTDASLFGAIATSSKGTYYFKAVGPKDEIARWREQLIALLDSLQFAR